MLIRRLREEEYYADENAAFLPVATEAHAIDKWYEIESEIVEKLKVAYDAAINMIRRARI